MGKPHTMPLFLQPLVVFLISIFIINSQALTPSLTLDYYTSTCPNAQEIVRKEMECVVQEDPHTAAFVLRLHFHDCFVQGCDGSILLDDTITLQGEKKALPNLNSLKGFDIVDRIKNKLESECPGIVSCADLLTIAARDAVILVGGPYWHVPLGRKDSKTANFEGANTYLPTSDQGLLSLIAKFIYQGFSVTEMVALIGAHTIGSARCQNFRDRIHGDYQETMEKNLISETHLNNLKSMCPSIGGNSENKSSMDYVTPTLFDNSFYQILLRGEGLLNSDQELYSSVLAIETKNIVRKYAEDGIAFFQAFSDSMVKMGNITGDFENGEVRKICRFVNT